MSPPTLEGARVRLRGYRDDDADALFAVFGDPRVTRYWSFAAWTDRAQAEAHLAKLLASPEPDALGWAIARRADDALIGTVTLYAIRTAHRRAELGYSLRVDHQGQGLAREAVRLALDYALGDAHGDAHRSLGLFRIEADVDPRNAASCRMLEQLGFQREGLLRARWRVNGEVCDTALFGLVADDYRPG